MDPEPIGHASQGITRDPVESFLPDPTLLGQQQWQGRKYTMPSKTIQPRVRQACARCRKQKLRCDNGKPCALCLRADTECVECPTQQRVSRKATARKLSKSVRQDPEQARPEGHHSVTSYLESRRREPELLDETTNDSIASANEEVVQLPASISPQTRTSTYGLVGQLFRKYDAAPELNTVANAIPSGSPLQSTPLLNRIGFESVVDMIAMDLPPPQITDLLIDSYLTSVHWFMLIIHAPTFRAELRELLVTGYVLPHRLPFLVLILLVLAIGAKYLSENPSGKHFNELDWHDLHLKLISKVEEKFFTVFDETDIESVQVCVLLGSYYIFHGKAKRTWVILGTALKSAEAIGLHKESSWPQMPMITREVWRRVWCTLYGSDGFLSISYGRPCNINEDEWQVSMPCNLDDMSARCPGFGSLELLENGEYEPVTMLSYQRYKFKIYQIAASITGGIYFYNGGTMQEIVEKVKLINRRLLDWDKSLLSELRTRSFVRGTVDGADDPILKTFRLQALTLQLTYDNIQLLLHRPLLAYTETSFQMSLPPTAPEGPESDLRRYSGQRRSSGLTTNGEVLRASKKQCWESAMRTSRTSELRTALSAAANTHAAAFAGIQTFTAGVMLSIFALSNPFSVQAQESKQAIGRLIQLPRQLGYHTTVSDQCGAVLEDLIRLILSEEMKALTHRKGGDATGLLHNCPPSVSSSHQACQSSAFEAPPTLAQSVRRTDLDDSSGTSWKANQGLGTTAESSPYRHQLGMGLAREDVENYDLAGKVPANPEDFFMTTSSNFNDALLSLQSFSGSALSALDGTGQSWMWDDSFQFT